MPTEAQPLSHQPRIDTKRVSLLQLPEQLSDDLFENGVDEGKMITGRFKMTWPPGSGKKETIATILSASSPASSPPSFQMTFILNDDYLELLDVSPHDDFRLSLKGAEVQKHPQTLKSCTLPLQLVFSKGLHIEWKRKGDSEFKTLNTWLLKESDDSTCDSWFLSQDENETIHKNTAKRKHAEIEEGGQKEDIKFKDPSTSKEQKRLRRKAAKRLKQEAASSKVTVEPSALSTSETHPDTPIETGKITTLLPSTQALTHEHKTTPQVVPDPNASNSEISPSNGITSMNAGFSVKGHSCPALNKIQRGRAKLLIGVVTEMSKPRVTATGEWMRFLHIVDSSNYQMSSLKINCFTKRHKEWLPHPEMGDVLILQNAQIVDYRGNLTGTGYHDKLAWAAFSPTKGQIHHGPPNAAPKSEGLGTGGLGFEHSPFYRPALPEVQYCISLSDWWRDATKQITTNEITYSNAETSSDTQAAQSVHRVHRLICEAGPSVPPNGYFDCTVEVIKTFPDEYHPKWMVFVTDYTHNAQVTTVSARWCPPSLSEFVLPLEMWDSAATIAQTMRPGQFYSIKNARMRVNPSGYLEGKVVQDKIVKVESDSNNTHLQALIERKRAWEAKKGNIEPEIAYLRIEETEENKLFTCAVELLHISSSRKERSSIYVTDYTSHKLLTPSPVSEPWAHGLEGRILRVLLADEQKDVLNFVKTGSFYCIKKLRLKYSPLEGCVCGILGGPEKLVVLLNPDRTNNEHLNGLLRRKDLWKLQNGPAGDMIRPASPQIIAPTTVPDNCSTCVKEIANSDSVHHQIMAKVVDFYPLELNDAFYQLCTNCKVEIPKSQRACTKCGDFAHEHVQYFYQLYVMLEDEDDHQILVSIDDKCSLLDGLKRTCINEDGAALSELRERTAPLLGNLIMVHNGLRSNKCIEIDTPRLRFEVQSWFLPEGKRLFRLGNYSKT